MDFNLQFKSDNSCDKDIIKDAFKSDKTPNNTEKRNSIPIDKRPSIDIDKRRNENDKPISKNIDIIHNGFNKRINKSISKFILDNENVNNFKTVVEAHRWAFPKYEKWIKGLTNNEHRAIFKYCYGETDKRINSFYKQNSDVLSFEDRLIVKFLETALEKSYVPEDIVVYKGKKGDSFKEILKLKKDEIIGKSIVEKGFMSTSLVESVSMRHELGILLKINVPKGSKGGYVGTISEHLEAEILFGLNKELIIKNVKEKNNVTIIECDLVRECDELSETRSIYSVSEDESISSGFHGMVTIQLI